MLYVRNRSVAEEVVQETWLGVIRGLDRFEGRSLMRTWIFRILTNTAKTRAARESRSVPFSSLAAPDTDDGRSVEPERFRGSDDR
jgi:RNA polymerase sigma-70 factor (ECF subfamily)